MHLFRREALERFLLAALVLLLILAGGVTIVPGRAHAANTCGYVENTNGVTASGQLQALCDLTTGAAGSPSAAAAAGIVPVVTSAPASGLVAKASPGNLYGFTGHSTVSGWFLIINATACPADGAVAPIEFVRYDTPDQTRAYQAFPPIRGSAGLSICFSTTGPYTKTASATASISSKAK